MKAKKILIPLDGSALAESALWKALAFIDKERTSLLLLRATEVHVRPGADLVDAQVDAVRDAEEYLGRVARGAAAAGVSRVDISVWYGAPASSIVEAARFNGVDLIVMSTHGRSGLGRLILGSVTESVLRSTAVPVLVLRADGAPLDVLRAGALPAEVSHV